MWGLLIPLPFLRRRRKRKFATGHAPVRLNVPQHHRALLVLALHDLHTVHQPVLPTHPDLRFAVGLLVPLRHEPDHVDRTRVRERVGPHALGRAALARLLHELPDQIGPGGVVLGDAGPDHLAWRGARRVEPEETTVRHDAITFGGGEPHRKTTGTHLV